MNKRTSTSVVILIQFLMILSVQALVVTPNKKLPIPPQAKNIPPVALNITVRASLACGSAYLLNQIKTNYLHYAAPPMTTRKVTGWKSNKTYTVKYSWKDVPAYKNIYEEYETFAVGSSQSVEARKMGKVKRRRVIGTKKCGTQKRLFRDPKGDVVRTHTQHLGPIYGEGAEYWGGYVTGDSALALLALLKSGIPETNPILIQQADLLDSYVNTFGISDLTWNVAWMATAFSNLRNKKYDKTRSMLINRILDGQVTDGRARGMWGPICVNRRILSSLVAHEGNLGETLKQLKAKLKKKPKSSARRQAVEETEQKLKAFEDIYRSITQQGLRFDNIQKRFLLKDSSWDTQQRFMAGLPYYFYNRTLADMESTSLALYAIREAAENGYLPKKNGCAGFVKRQAQASDGPFGYGFAAIQQYNSAISSRSIHTPERRRKMGPMQYSSGKP